MVHFEAALAAALEKHAVIPQGVAACIVAAGRDEFDRNALAEQARAAGNIVIPFVKVLTARVAAIDRQAANFVHWGATSQDVLDTALMLQLRQGLILLRVDAEAACKSLATLARKHRFAEMPGRTWLQQGPPVTLGLKIAGWLDALQRHRQRLSDLLQHNFALQLGGAVGTLAALDPMVLPWQRRWLLNSTWHVPRSPGTRIGTGSRRWRLFSDCWPGPWARSVATSPSSCRPGSGK